MFAILGLWSAIFIFIYGIGSIYIAIWFFIALCFMFTHKALSYNIFSPLWMALPLFYLVHLFAMLYTHNLKSGWFDLEVKLSLVILPFIFYFQHKQLNRQNTRFFKWFYTFSILGITVFLIVKTAIAFQKTNNIGLWYYNELSTPYHPTYLAMYVVMAIVFLYDFLITLNHRFIKLVLFIWILLQLVFIYLLSSKAGILSAIIVLLLMSLHYIVRKRIILIPLIILFIAILFAYVGVFGNFRFKALENTIQTTEINVTTTESNAARWLVWQAGLKIAQENWLLGVGTGDIKESLINEYDQRGMTGAVEKKLNAHNQFLETLVGQGIVGLLMLLLVFLMPFYRALKTYNLPWLMFIVLTAFNFLFESMLNTQGGVFFFSYFYAFFAFESKLNQI
ncbi:MAG: O-antigen ligase family protein [Bacteroidales bacterium]|nr:O-antigen ligase family protein [Bacteroidales bacterium]